MQNLDWLTDALGEFEDDYVRFSSLFYNPILTSPDTLLTCMRSTHPFTVNY